MDSVSWNDCSIWLWQLNRWLTEHWREQGFAGEAPKLRMPGEGEWEAACRAESMSPFHFGDTLDPDWANYDPILAMERAAGTRPIRIGR